MMVSVVRGATAALLLASVSITAGFHPDDGRRLVGHV
jgi:hypothetical protein